MLLAIDVGNTNMVLGIYEGEELKGSFRLMTDANRTSDEMGLLMCEYFQRFGGELPQGADRVNGAEVPQGTRSLRRWRTRGARVSIDGLFQQTALRPRVELVKPDAVLSTTAVGQIQAGAVMGYIGAMEYLIRQAKQEMGGGDIKVIATGGLARMVADNTDLIDVVDPQLVLDGLRIIYQREKKKQ